jgi:hypothetical protein
VWLVDDHPVEGLGEDGAPAVSGTAVAGIGAFAALSLAFHAFGGWVPLLDSANLAIHEGGHPLFALLSGRLGVYGGTLMQLAFPVAVAVHFHRQANAAGVAGAGVWLGENLLNVARYMADARAGELPLVGGGDHDWLEIFSRWGVLQWDTRIAGFTRVLAVVLLIASVAWLARRWHSGRAGR